MKKSIAGILCVMLFVALSGCGDTKKDLLANPADKDVKAAIEKLDGVKSTCMVTEDNDPNGKLNKDGGYTGAVYFRLKQVDDQLAKEKYSSPYGDDACDVGTIGGGQIEIYANEKDANKRNDYLSSFDGSVVGDFHSVKGTLVIRLSDDLTASQQKDLEKQIIELMSEKK